MEDKLLQDISKSIGLIFLLERRLEYLFDKVLAASNLTTKQWLLLAAIEKSPEENLSIQDVAKRLSTSHQNIKAIAQNLERRGFVSLFKDKNDKRVTRLAITPKCTSFWQEREGQDKELLFEIFNGLGDEEISTLPRSLVKLLRNADSITDRIIKTEISNVDAKDFAQTEVIDKSNKKNTINKIGRE